MERWFNKVSFMTGYPSNWPFIRIAMQSMRALLAGGKVISYGIMYEWVSIELTVHTHVAMQTIKVKGSGFFYSGTYTCNHLTSSAFPLYNVADYR